MDPPRPPRTPINVTPLRSIPLPPDSNSSQIHPPQEGFLQSSPRSFIYLQSEPSEEEWHALLSTNPGAVCLSGAAAGGAVGPVVGKMNIGENSTFYNFRVSLPGVARDSLECDVASDGHVKIQGYTTTGESVVYRNGMRFQMVTQNLPPPGYFSVSFKLSGPVESQQLTARLGIDGIFEGVVKKRFE